MAFILGLGASYLAVSVLVGFALGRFLYRCDARAAAALSEVRPAIEPQPRDRELLKSGDAA